MFIATLVITIIIKILLVDHLELGDLEITRKDSEINHLINNQIKESGTSMIMSLMEASVRTTLFMMWNVNLKWEEELPQASASQPPPEAKIPKLQ